MAEGAGNHGGYVRTIAVVLVLAALVYARVVVVPLAAAVLIALTLMPWCRQLVRRGVPRTLAAILLLGLLIGSAAAILYSVHDPLSRIASEGPELLRSARHQVTSIAGAGHPEPRAQTVQRDQGMLLDAAQIVAAQTSRTLLATGTAIVLCFFLLTAGPGVSRALLTALLERPQRRTWLRVCAAIQYRASQYLLFVTLINVALGVAATGLLMWFGLPDAPAYGALVAIFNFVPFVGALLSTALILVGSIAHFGMHAAALGPAAGFLMLHVIESQFVTPHLMGRHMLLNPLIVILGIIAGAAAWGIGGGFLAIPLLTSLKIAADAHPMWRRWGQVLGRGTQSSV